MFQDQAIEQILEACGPDTVTLRPGDILFKEGDEARAMYVVKSGLLRVLSGSTIYETVGPGGIIGEMGIIEQDVPRSATVIAGTHCELVEIDHDRFLSLVTSIPSFAVAVLRVVSRRLRVMNRRYRSNIRA